MRTVVLGSSSGNKRDAYAVYVRDDYQIPPDKGQEKNTHAELVPLPFNPEKGHRNH